MLCHTGHWPLSERKMKRPCIIRFSHIKWQCVDSNSPGIIALICNDNKNKITAFPYNVSRQASAREKTRHTQNLLNWMFKHKRTEELMKGTDTACQYASFPRFCPLENQLELYNKYGINQECDDIYSMRSPAY